jgi:hypothetical protein
MIRMITLDLVSLLLSFLYNTITKYIKVIILGQNISKDSTISGVFQGKLSDMNSRAREDPYDLGFLFSH